MSGGSVTGIRIPGALFPQVRALREPQIRRLSSPQEVRIQIADRRRSGRCHGGWLPHWLPSGRRSGSDQGRPGQVPARRERGQLGCAPGSCRTCRASTTTLKPGIPTSRAGLNRRLISALPSAATGPPCDPPRGGLHAGRVEATTHSEHAGSALGIGAQACRLCARADGRRAARVAAPTAQFCVLVSGWGGRCLACVCAYGFGLCQLAGAESGEPVPFGISWNMYWAIFQSPLTCF
jgi:hypothetical protein